MSGDGVTVGIVDSATGPPPDVAERYDVEPGEDYTDVSALDPTDHGSWVFGAASQFARGATYRFYRLLGGGTKYGTDFLEPLADAAADGVDLLNVSAGFPATDERGSYRVGEAVRTEAENGLTVVAAAGNVRDDPDEEVHCPARFDDVIAVGGFVPSCTGRVDESDADRRLWIRTENRPRFPRLQGPLCNQDACAGNESCDENRFEEWWGGNLAPAGDAPNALAPVHYLTSDDRGPYLVPGTSFSTPIVTGLLAAILGSLDGSPSPREIKEAVANGGIQLDDGSGEKFNARLVRATLS